MKPCKRTEQPGMLPSLMVFGPQARPSRADLVALRSQLISNARLSKLLACTLDLPNFWVRLVRLDPELARVPGDSLLRGLAEWLASGHAGLSSFLCWPSDLPATLASPINYLIQVVQYQSFLAQLTGEDNAQQAMLERLRDGGVQGFCLGLLCAITVASSTNEEELFEIAIRALWLAVCIGAYVDKDTLSHTGERALCISVRGTGTRAGNYDRIVEMLRDFPKAYISAVTDETSLTITTLSSSLSKLMDTLAGAGCSVQSVPVEGRFHCSVYASDVDRLVNYFRHAPDLRFPSTDQLHVAVRSAIDGRVISQGDLVQHVLENTLLKPVEWYETLKLAVASLSLGRRCVVLAGISTHFPASLTNSEWNVRLLSMRGGSSTELKARMFEELSIDDDGSSIDHASPGAHAPPSPIHTDTDDDAVLSLENGGNTASPSSTRPKLSLSGLSDFPPHSVAVVGMAGRFPGANSVDELWELISKGRSMVESAPERVGMGHLPKGMSEATWWGNFLDGHDTFDHKFFNKSAREAAACDPQQRKLLEVVYDALESSGQLGAEARSGSASTDYGCYIGAVTNNYATNVSCHPPTAYAITGTTRAFLSGAVSHFFGWTGPAMTIDTACSSSLVAVHTACRAIAAGECSRAIAGGVNIITCPHDYRDLKAAGFLSSTGQCKPFDIGADGYCRGEAVCAVVLKSMAAAMEENDNILGVVAGSATSQNTNDGPIVVPNARSQADLLRKAIGISNVLPEEVTYVEAHGTGTGVGDPIEVQSLRKAFGGPSRMSKLHFSSLKGNIGHAEAASGVAGLIKVLLMMRNGQIPPQASYQILNPSISALGPDGMAIPQHLMPWNPPIERIACVNNYGAAGSNSVVIIREAPSSDYELDMTEAPAVEGLVSPSRWPLILTASTKASLSLYGQKLLDWVRHVRSGRRSDAQIRVADILFNLSHRANHSLNSVVATSVTDISHLEAVLSRVASEGATDIITTTPSAPPPVVLAFGGQEGRYVGLSDVVYKSSHIFRYHLDICHHLSTGLGLVGSSGLYPAIFQQTPLEDIVALHVALFSMQYACARAWMDCGLKVAAVIGHSFGQLTALCISGVLSLRDALRLVAGRASLVKEHWGPDVGSMIALQADRQVVTEIIEEVTNQSGGYAEIACFNGPRSHVVVGSQETMQAVQDLVSGSGNSRLGASARSSRLDVTHGFHSVFTETLLPHLADLADKLEWRRPTIHLEVCSEKDVQNVHDPDQYRHLTVEHTRRPVYFQQAVKRLMKAYPQATWLEAGRGSSVTQLARASAQGLDRVSFLSPQLSTSAALDSLVDVTVKLWRDGHSVQYWPFHRSQRWEYKYLSLPTYQFQRTRHWLPFKRLADRTADLTRRELQGSEDRGIVRLIKGDKSSKETLFRISPPESKRFQALVTGHVVCGHTLVPASAYIEIASRAALTLQEDLKADTWVPTVENLVMRAPIAGLGSEQALPYMTMTMVRLDNSWPSWYFTITASPYSGENGDPSLNDTHEATTGSVHLHKRTDPHSQVAQDMRRFSAMTGYNLWKEIMDHPETEGMRGKHIYRAFSQVVEYSEAFRGVKTIMCLGAQAAGTVRIAFDNKDPPDQRLTDTPMIDSFMQFGGLLANYFNEDVSSRDTVFVCHHLQRVQVGPAFSPDSHEWFVLANMTSIDQDSLSVDVYVFETRSKKMVLTALGMSFAKMSRTSLTRMLTGSGPIDVLSSNSPRVSKVHKLREGHAVKDLTSQATIHQTSSDTLRFSNSSLSKRAEILRIAASIADIPENELSGETSIAAIVDSLGATEMIGDINSALDVSIDLSTFLLFPNINAIINHVDAQLGLPVGVEGDAPVLSPGEAATTAEFREPRGLGLTNNSTSITMPRLGNDPGYEKFPRSHNASRPKAETSTLPTPISIYQSFEDVRLTFDELGAAANALDYWSHIYPGDVRLVLAYITEAFRSLSCDMEALAPGETVPEVLGVLPRHRRLVCRLYRVLEEQGVIAVSGSDRFTRTAKAIDATPSEQIFQQVVGKHPANDATRHLMRAIGPHIAECLTGHGDALQILFGNRLNKKWLDELYRNWPMLVTATQLLGNFLCRAFTDNLNDKTTRIGPFRILEVGAGTGGTTRHIVDLLTRHGIPFEYHFTDISGTLVQKARASFADVEGMEFSVLDIESEPTLKPTEAFHAIISTNCIHATRNITRSLEHLRTMLREDGVLALIEMTPSPSHPLYVMDVIFGLLEGWWLFDDGRSHALADVERWGRAFADAGFQEVLWSDGATLEAKTVRVICGFQTPKATRRNNNGRVGIGGQTDVSIQEVVYKRAGVEKVHADIYCPTSANSAKKMPIALMIHGGSHILFSRKDIRPPQTRIMLDMGLLPVSLDHRLCPEIPLADGPMVDICDALEWARTKLPFIELLNPDIKPDPDNVVVVGWSSGGQLALSTGWTAPKRGLRPPRAVLAFYCPTDYEDDWWQNPIQPIGAEDWGADYDILEAVQDAPITNYGTIGAWEPLSDPRILSDPRARIVLHMNWKAQTLPVVIGGLPSKSKLARQTTSTSEPGSRASLERHRHVKNSGWNALPQPPLEEIRRCSPLAQVKNGNYTTPTFLVHGTEDDLIPWQQSFRMNEEMKARGIEARLMLVPGGPHICDASHNPESAGWQAVLEAYRWLEDRIQSQVQIIELPCT